MSKNQAHLKAIKPKENRLRDMRLKAKLTLDEMAAILGKTRGSLIYMEKHQTPDHPNYPLYHHAYRDAIKHHQEKQERRKDS